MKSKTIKVYKKRNKNKKLRNKSNKLNNTKKHNNFNSSIIHPASIILPRK